MRGDLLESWLPERPEHQQERQPRHVGRDHQVDSVATGLGLKVSIATKVLVATLALGACLVFSYYVGSGLGGLIQCGTFNLSCAFVSVLSLPLGPAIAAPLLWQAASKTDRSDLSWFWVRAFAWIVTGVLVALLLGFLFAFCRWRPMMGSTLTAQKFPSTHPAA